MTSLSTLCMLALLPQAVHCQLCSCALHLCKGAPGAPLPSATYLRPWPAGFCQQQLWLQEALVAGSSRAAYACIAPDAMHCSSVSMRSCWMFLAWKCTLVLLAVRMPTAAILHPLHGRLSLLAQPSAFRTRHACLSPSSAFADVHAKVHVIYHHHWCFSKNADLDQNYRLSVISRPADLLSAHLLNVPRASL